MKLYQSLFFFLVPLFLFSKAEQSLPQLEIKLIKQGLVNIQKIDPSIIVELKYSTKDNFLKEDVYGDLNRCYLQKKVASMLAKAHQYLKKMNSKYRFLVYDGVRPRSVQFKMWDIVKNSDQRNYVANPYKGSIHNYGSAVDLTLIDEDGQPLDMGTPFDHLGKLAQPRYEKKYLKIGKLTWQQVRNRRLLRKVMLKAGFKMIRSEWWHFNAFSRKEVKRRYQVVE